MLFDMQKVVLTRVFSLFYALRFVFFLLYVCCVQHVIRTLAGGSGHVCSSTAAYVGSFAGTTSFPDQRVKMIVMKGAEAE